jgi:hypothetical protein
MTKGEKIASMFAHMDYYERCSAVIDAVIDTAKREARVECAGICTTKHFAADAARDILALNAPPAPAYPFGKDATGRQCACWHHHLNGNYYRQRDSTSPRCLPADAAYCEVCGAKRKGI